MGDFENWMYKIDTFFYFALVDANALRCEHNAAKHRICFQGNGLFEVCFENVIRKWRRVNVGQNVMENYLRGRESWLMNERIEECIKWMNCR